MDSRAFLTRRARLSVEEQQISPHKQPVSLNFSGVFDCKGSEYGGSACDGQSECGGAEPIIDADVLIFRDQVEVQQDMSADESDCDEMPSRPDIGNYQSVSM